MTSKKLERLLKQVLQQYNDGEVIECLATLKDLINEIEEEIEEYEREKLDLKEEEQ